MDDSHPPVSLDDVAFDDEQDARGGRYSMESNWGDLLPDLDFSNLVGSADASSEVLGDSAGDRITSEEAAAAVGNVQDNLPDEVVSRGIY